MAIAFWFFGCTALGLAVTGFIGEHGSIVWALLGFAVGLSGAVAHGGLLFSSRFRSQSRARRALMLWGATMLVLVLSTAGLAALSEGASMASIVQALSFAFVAGAVPVLLAAAAFNYVAG